MRLVIAMLLAWIAGPATAGEVTVAHAANFTRPLKAIAAAFTAETGHDVRAISGSTGLLYAQILRGAPFDVFLAADTERPARLAAQGRGQAPFAYAYGRLVLLGGDRLALKRTDLHAVAIANPDVAPYGRAALETLQALGANPPLVYGENVAQAYAMVASGSAQLGLIARSHAGGEGWLVPSELHSPIRQDAIRLTEAPEDEAFLAFLQSPAAREIIQSFGYEPP